MGTLSRRSTMLLTCAAAGLSRVAWAADAHDFSAPFGLTWEASPDDIRKAGVKLTPEPAVKTYGMSFAAANLSKVLVDTDSVLLSFGYDDKLWHIATAGQVVGPDPSGSRIIVRYLDLAASLSAKYGRGVETDIRDTEMWKNPNEYVMSLKQGRAYRYTTYKTNDLEIQLSIRAADADNAFYVILFSYLQGEGEFNTAKKAHEKDAL